MYWFVLKSIMGSIIGSSFYQWWQGTTMGIWFQKHVDTFMQYLAVKYGIEVAKKDAKFRKQFPLIADRLAALEEKVLNKVTTTIDMTALWQHTCVGQGTMSVGKGEECNWCGATEIDG
jgi:hypothetical protein